MTTIVTDGTTIAADSLTTFGHERGHRAMEKVQVAKGKIYASSGLGAMLPVLIAWHQAGADPEKVPRVAADEHWSLLVIEPAGMFLYTIKCPYALQVDPPFGLGMGADYAMGAMAWGASPREAVGVACRFSTTSGGPVQVVDIAEALRREAPKLEAAE